jgi:hypothetical protein
VEKRRPLVCAACGTRVTWADRRMQVSGRHAHTAVNPHGIEFHFGCFSEADGCAVHGVPTDEHSWFAGCSWQYAHCRGCGAHLGWYFTRAATFFGLVLNRLAPGGERPDG